MHDTQCEWECVSAFVLLHVCSVHKHENRHDLHVSAVSCVRQARFVCPRGSAVTPRACRPTLSTLLVVSESLWTHTCVLPTHVCVCVFPSVSCHQQPSLHRKDLLRSKVKGPKVGVHPFQKWKVTKVKSGVKWHWTSTQLQNWQLIPFGTCRTSHKGGLTSSQCKVLFQ